MIYDKELQQGYYNGGLEMGYIYCPSLMCADFAHLKRELNALQEAGADIVHVDMMDDM